ncbi:hypothetical protein RYX36_031552 [Vicia faba]
MGKTTASNSALQMSVSFGRFENDSLSWERWSYFYPNKYLEEVEKCATPGSVTQKKAYFEAHYKKIVARKAELLAQDKETEKATQVKEKVVKLDHPNESKVISVNRENNVAKTKKKPVQPKSKASQISTPRSSKLISNPTKTSTSASSTKKGNSPSLPKRQLLQVWRTKKATNSFL